MPTVSVIIPSYNHEKYIGECIQSVLDQTYQDFEVVITDDGSADRTVEVIESFSDPRIRLFKHSKNRGAPVTINNCIQHASGKYIAAIGSDDAWYPEKLERQVRYLDEHPEIAVVFSKVDWVNESGDLIIGEQNPYKDLFEVPNKTRFEWLRYFFEQGNCLNMPSSLVRGECFAEIGLLNPLLAGLHDFDLWIRICLKHDIMILDEKLVRYRWPYDGSNASGNTEVNNARNRFEYKQIYDDYLQITKPDELLTIFPYAVKYGKVKKEIIPYFLGRMAIDSGLDLKILWGMETLYTLMQNDEATKVIEKNCKFEYSDFINIAHHQDVFNHSFIVQLAERERVIAEQEQKLIFANQQLNEFLVSKALKFVLFLRAVRVKLLPPGSWRKRMARLAYRALQVLYNGGAGALIRKIRGREVAPSYRSWILKNEPRLGELKRQRQTTQSFAHQPLISIVVPVFNTPSRLLSEMIESVLSQTYDNWELCIANGSPESRDICKILKEYSGKDRRIKIVQLEKNLGIAGNTNAALAQASGDFVGFLDHDDRLPPFALFEVANWLQVDTTADLIYSDEDKIDKGGRRFDPFFKPDFSPDYLRSVNYMPHFLVVRKSLGDQVAWLREGYDGAQDYDLILRVVEKARRVVHIPKILYHWRAWTESTASGADAKPSANAAGKKALQEHLDRIGLPAEVKDGYSSTTYHAHYQLEKKPLISIIIPNQDHASDLRQCVNSIFQKTTYPNYEIVLVENGSKEQGTFSLYSRLEEDTRIRLIKWNEPFNYSRVNNWAAAQAAGEVILFLNNDIQVITSDWLEQMLQFAMRRDVGAVGAKLYYPDGSIQHAGVIIGVGGIAGHSHKDFPAKHTGYFGRLALAQNVSAVTAACVMIRSRVLREVGGFDENFVLAFGDVDLCLRILQKGYLNIWTPYAELFHYESKTRGYEDNIAKQRRFKRERDYFEQKWSDFLQKGDPYYNPNLTLSSGNFSINPNPANASARSQSGLVIEKNNHHR